MDAHSISGCELAARSQSILRAPPILRPVRSDGTRDSRDIIQGENVGRAVAASWHASIFLERKQDDGGGSLVANAL